MNGVFVIEQDAYGEYLFQFRIGDQTVLKSWLYKSKAGCTKGIAWVQKHSSNPDCFVKSRTPPGKHRFQLMALNGRVLVRSSLYKSADEYAEGVASVQALARGALVNDRTASANSIYGRTARVHNAPLRYRIYAAPRGPDGNYWPQRNKPLLIKGFATEQERDAYWSERILPATVGATNKKGEEYKYSKCNFPVAVPWHWVDEPRYSDGKLIEDDVGSSRGDSARAESVRRR